MPAVLGIGLLPGRTVILGLATEMVLPAMTLPLSMQMFSARRTAAPEGAVQLAMFVDYLVPVFNP